MKVPICFELTIELEAKAFTGPVFIAGQAIIEEDNGTWSLTPSSPPGTALEASSRAEVVHGLSEFVRLKCDALAASSKDRFEFEAKLAHQLASPSVHDEWLELARGVNRADETVLEIPIVPNGPAAPEIHFFGPGEAVLYGTRVYVPGKLGEAKLAEA